METIRSSGNPGYRQALKLAGNRRERLKQGCTLLSGVHLVAAARDARWPMQRIMVREGHRDDREVAALLASAECPVIELDAGLFDTLEQMPSPTGVLAVAEVPAPPPIASGGLCVLLEGVQDPGNVGTILRTAAAAGTDQAWLATGCADAWSPRVLRAAMGAHFVMPVIERVDAVAAMGAFRGTRAITALGQAESIHHCNLGGDLLLVLGAEGQGVSPALAELATLRLRIPMRAGIESLNVSAAAAVCLFERSRQVGDPR